MPDKESLVKIFCSNIQGVSGGKKIPRMRCRTTNSDIVVLNEVNKFTDDSLDVGCKYYKISNTPNPDRTGPGFGTFVGTKSFDADLGDKFLRHDKFEIVICIKNYENFSIGVIGMYRSPSMDNSTCDEFYFELEKFISDHIRSVDILIVSGNDNAHDDPKSSSKARRAYHKLEEIRKHYKGHHVIKSKTRKNHQTDHVLAFYDIFKFNVI